MNYIYSIVMFYIFHEDTFIAVINVLTVDSFQNLVFFPRLGNDLYLLLYTRDVGGGKSVVVVMSMMGTSS